MMKKMRKSTGMNTPRKRKRGKLPKKEMKSLNTLVKNGTPMKKRMERLPS